MLGVNGKTLATTQIFTGRGMVRKLDTVKKLKKQSIFLMTVGKLCQGHFLFL